MKKKVVENHPVPAPRYNLTECAELLDRPENPFFMFGIDACRFQTWENYRDGLLTRENAIERLFQDQ
ncbi:MAG TPA: hypothetical protein PLV42_05595 [bacterium]|nr:hypothetical protein [bacterium]